MSSLLFWDVTQRGFIVIDVSVQPIGSLKIGPMSGLYDRGDRCAFSGKRKNFTSSPDAACLLHSAYRGVFALHLAIGGFKLTTYLYLVLRLMATEATPPLYHTLSWRLQGQSYLCLNIIKKPEIFLSNISGYGIRRCGLICTNYSVFSFCHHVCIASTENLQFGTRIYNVWEFCATRTSGHVAVATLKTFVGRTAVRTQW